MKAVRSKPVQTVAEIPELTFTQLQLTFHLAQWVSILCFSEQFHTAFIKNLINIWELDGSRTTEKDTKENINVWIDYWTFYDFHDMSNPPPQKKENNKKKQHLEASSSITYF